MRVSIPPPTTTQARQQLRRALALRSGRGTVITTVLLASLGFVAAVQIASPDEVLDRASRADLIQVLDGLGARSSQLEQEIDRLEQARTDLVAGAGDSEAALAEAQERLDTLGILAGSVPAQGPGVLLTIGDPEGVVDAAAMLGSIQELRDAGAEAIQVSGSPDRAVRVVASTAFVDVPNDGVAVGGVALSPPYTVAAIGDPSTLATALGIPGGAVASLKGAGAVIAVRESPEVVVDALHEATEPAYARPADPDQSETTG